MKHKHYLFLNVFIVLELNIFVHLSLFTTLDIFKTFTVLPNNCWHPQNVLPAQCQRSNILILNEDGIIKSRELVPPLVPVHNLLAGSDVYRLFDGRGFPFTLSVYYSGSLPIYLTSLRIKKKEMDVMHDRFV